MSTAGAAARVRDALAVADYTADGVERLLGPAAHAALARAETVPAERVTRGGGPLETLVRLFLLQRPVPEAAAAAALPLVDALALGLVERSGADVWARLDVRPYGEAGEGEPLWWVVSDLGTGLDGRSTPLRNDHVLGVGGASTTLAQITPRQPVQRVLDLGTGCGVQALHLSRHAQHVVATDVLPRALRLARLTGQLSRVDLDLREGSLWDPVEGEEYDLVVSNPPFVVAPAGGTYAYRDSGLPGDEACARLVAGATAHLVVGGQARLLANWVHRRGEDWRERVAGWLPEDADAVVLQREVLDPAEYVALWLRDSGEVGATDYADRYDAWLSALEQAGVEAIGFGWIALRRTSSIAAQVVRDWPHTVTMPLGEELGGRLERIAWLANTDDATLLATAYRVAPDVTEERIGAPGEEDPHHIVLRRSGGLRPAREVGTVEAALVGACDGRLSALAILRAVAHLLGADLEPAAHVASLRLLAEEGFVHPVGMGSPASHV